MAKHDCGFCDLLRKCGASIVDKNDFATIAARLLCDIADNTAAASPGGGQDDVELLLLCDIKEGDTTQFLRYYLTAPDGSVTTVDTQLNGLTPYVTSGVIGQCPADITIPDQTLYAWQQYCDPTVGVPVLVRIKYQTDGTILEYAAEYPDGTPYGDVISNLIDCSAATRQLWPPVLEGYVIAAATGGPGVTTTFASTKVKAVSIVDLGSSTLQVDFTFLSGGPEGTLTLYCSPGGALQYELEDTLNNFIASVTITRLDGESDDVIVNGTASGHGV